MNNRLNISLILSAMVFFISVTILCKEAKGTFPRQLEEIRIKAEQGDAESLYRLGMVYENGTIEVEKNLSKAVSFYEQAASKGYLPAISYLGYCYYDGKIVKRDVDKGLKMIEQAAMQGDVKAANNLGWLLLEGEGVVHDAKKAVYWFGRSAESGFAISQSQLGDLYRLGNGVEKDEHKAEELYIKAGKQGLRDAENKLLAMKYTSYKNYTSEEAFEAGSKFYSDRMYVVAVTLFEIAAEKGSVSAKLYLGECYATGRGVVYSFEKGLKYYYEAAKEGDASAQYVVAETLEMFPDSIAEDDKGATYWYERAAEQGVLSAEQAAERMYNLSR